MNLYRSLSAIVTASGDGTIDWDAVATATKAATHPGSLDLDPGERDGYARDVRDACDRVREVTALEFSPPTTVEIQNRHHWVDANLTTFQRVMAPLEHQRVVLPEVTRRVNTGVLAGMLSFLSNHVLGQYDPLLLADADTTDHGLYFVRPNIQRVARMLDVDYDRFRRWIVFHEVTHAAEFGAAPWLTDHLEPRLEAVVARLARGEFDRNTLRELDTAMTAIEGYAEYVMDHAFDTPATDLREKLDAHRRGKGPLDHLIRRLLGLGLKRQQYERGRRFYDIIATHDPAYTRLVWTDPDHLPTAHELDHPRLWIQRVTPA